MSFKWFSPWGWLYRPVSIAGWLAVLVVIVFCVQVLVAVDGHSHSASDTLYGIFPYFVCSFMLLNWLASKTGGGGK